MPFPLANTESIEDGESDSSTIAVDFRPKNFIVYRIKNMSTGRMYFGSTYNRLRRWGEHMKELENLTHKNPGLVGDARYFGTDVFKFSVLFRFDNRAAMLAREQLLLNMYWGRSCCYNSSSEVAIGAAPPRITVMKLPNHGDFMYRNFLSAHAIARELGVRKREVVDAIKLRLDVIGRFGLTVTRTKLSANDSGRLIRKLEAHGIGPAEVRARYLGDTLNQFSSILDSSKASIDGLASAVLANRYIVEQWMTGKRRISGPQQKLIGIIATRGLVWARHAFARQFSPEAIIKLRKRHSLSQEWLAALLNCKVEEISKWEANTKAPGQVERLLMTKIYMSGMHELL